MNGINTSSAYDRGYNDFNEGKPFSNPYYDDNLEDENYYEYNRCKADEDWDDDLTFSFIKKLAYVEYKDKISLYISPNFLEWLFDHSKGIAAAIFPFTMKDYYGLENYNFTPVSSEKYKYTKIGFRICYEIQKDA